LNVVSEAVRQK